MWLYMHVYAQTVQYIMYQYTAYVYTQCHTHTTNTHTQHRRDASKIENEL